MKRASTLILFLAACGQTSSPLDEKPRVQPAAKQAAPPAPVAKAFIADEKNDLIEFHYAWSPEAAAVPQLVDRFRKDLNKVKAELIANASADKSFRERQQFDFHIHSSHTEYKTAGQSPRLLSMSVDAASYTGGAHGNYGTGALLWDRLAAREIKLTDVFAAPANMGRLLTDRWCEKLNKAREEKRGEAVGGGGLFDECPSLDEIAIIPTDNDGNGRFDMMVLIASPYVAGPYAEGSYQIELTLTPELMASLKGDYRTSFEVAHTQ